MKVTQIEFEKMKADLRVVFNYYKTIHNISFKGINDIPVSTYFNLWHIVYANKKYTDDNRNVIFVNGERLFKFDDYFEYYICDTDDNSLLTALKKAFKETVNEY